MLCVPLAGLDALTRNLDMNEHLALRQSQSDEWPRGSQC